MRLINFILLIGILFFSTNTVSGQSSSYINQLEIDGFIKQDSMNLAIIVLDFLSYELLEGRVDYYTLCDSCDLDSLPFNIEFMYPMDYGQILFKYAYNTDTLFYATIWWAGTGQIIYPDTFLSSNHFEYQEEPVQLPAHAQYFDYWLTPHGYSWDQFVKKADSAWNSIDSLEIVKEFSEYTYRVGIYAYTPVVGLFDPAYAKWIIFLYYGNTFTTGVSDQLKQAITTSVYPNPFTTTTTIEYELYSVSNIQFTIYNGNGEIVYQSENRNVPHGKHSITPSFQHLPAGIYYAVLKSDNGISMIKMIKQ